MPAITKYKCFRCGTKLVVTENMESRLMPIYCCGVEVEEISPAKKKAVKTKKKATKKKVAKKKKAVSKKKKR
ncbi:MAG: hypothetical protein HZA11_05850 [Nitrospirae bacterium]|nr:hypothetical protein [Nitrospirota bacterium]